MGQLTDSLRQLDRSKITERERKRLEKEETKNIKMQLYNIFNRRFANQPKYYNAIYKYFLLNNTRKKAHERTAPQLDFIDFYKIYDQVLNDIYKRYKKIDKLTTKPEEETPKNKNSFDPANLILAFIAGLFIPTNKNKLKKYKI